MSYLNRDREYDINISADPELENPKLLHLNRLPARATVIPALHKGVYYRNKEESELITLINGDYSFYYAPYDSMPEFYLTDFEESGWDRIDVPSMWQYRGYGKPAYPNVLYEIPFNPPYVSCENPVGYYRRHFSFSPLNSGGRAMLHFDGVDNAFYVYLNGKEVGMSKGSRMPAEFDVTDIIKEGDNLLAVKVFTHSDATYLENQDMLLANGIFRDIYLIDAPAVSVWDYEIISDLKGIDLTVTLSGKGEGYTVCAELGSAKAKASAVGETVKLRLEPENPILWNAENPYLYNLTFTLDKDGKSVEIHSKMVGLRTVRIEGSHLLVNGKPITLKGINRHEHDPKNGKALTPEQIERELRIIKKNNINAIRCSHYPDSPALYETAAQLGIYLADEADIETHGCEAVGDQGYLNKSPIWFDAFLDRTKRMVERDKNETAVIIWSIGNECGNGENTEKCAAYLRTLNDPKPVLQAQDDFYNPRFTDFRQNGYCTLAALEDYPDNGGKPLILTEYAHSMGNSPGGLYDYWNKIYHTDWFAGGFIWEFKNHGFFAVGENGKPRYLYGGDFGDFNHWSNFTLDGLLLSDGTQKPAMREVFQVYSPVWAEYRDGIRLLNTLDFTDLSELTLKWELLEDYNVIDGGIMPAPSAAPHTEVLLKPPYKAFEPIAGAVYRVNLRFYRDSSLVSFCQAQLPTVTKKEKTAYPDFDGDIKINSGIVTVTIKEGEIVFENGMLKSYTYKGEALPVENMKMSLYRAPTDNDGIVGLRDERAGDWNREYLHHAAFSCEHLKTERFKEFLRITAEGKTLPPAKFAGFETVLCYDIYSDGSIFVEMTGKPYGYLPNTLPRIGIRFEADGRYTDAEWYGRGDCESYPDRKLSAPFGLYSAAVNELNTIYDVPQETGNHEDTVFLNITDQNKRGITVIGSPNFAFSYHNYTLESLTRARHRDELCCSDKNYLYIDYKMRPLGSHSCGPEPEEKYELRPHAFRFCCTIAPYVSCESALKQARKETRAETQALSDTYSPRVCEAVPQNFNCI